MENQGTINDFLGIQVKYNNKGEITLMQPQLIGSILNDLHLQCNNIIACKTPAPSIVLLQKDPEGKPMCPEFNYHLVIGKLNFLEKSMHPDLVYVVHQCACFSTNPKQSHANAVKHIGHYLKGPPTFGIILHPHNQKTFQCWVDADCSSNWKPEGAEVDPMTAKSCSDWIITYTGCPITWASKLQTLTVLSTTKAKYMALSMAMHEQLPLLSLFQEVMAHDINTSCPQPPFTAKPLSTIVEH